MFSPDQMAARIELVSVHDLFLNQLIMVDTSPFPDAEGATAQHLVMRNKNANAALNKDVTARVAEICARRDYATMYKDIYVEEKNAALVARVAIMVHWVPLSWAASSPPRRE